MDEKLQSLMVVGGDPATWDTPDPSLGWGGLPVSVLSTIVRYAIPSKRSELDGDVPLADLYLYVLWGYGRVSSRWRTAVKVVQRSMCLTLFSFFSVEGMTFDVNQFPMPELEITHSYGSISFHTTVPTVATVRTFASTALSLTAINLNQVAEVGDETIAFIVQQAPNLTSVNLRWTSATAASLIPLSSLTQLRSIDMEARILSVKEFAVPEFAPENTMTLCPSLTSLDLTNRFDLFIGSRPTLFSRILRFFPNVKHLTVKTTIPLTSLAELEEEGTNSVFYAVASSSMGTTSSSSCVKRIPMPTGPPPMSMKKSYRNYQATKASNPTRRWFGIHDIRAVASLTQLTDLVAHVAPGSLTDSSLSLFAPLSSLRVLNIEGATFTSSGLESLARSHCPSLLLPSTRRRIKIKRVFKRPPVQN